MLAHFHLMKTAGQTVCDILRQSFADRHCDVRTRCMATPADLRLTERMYPNLKSIAGHTVYPTKRLTKERPDLRFFTFFRDPVQRCVSHYQFSLRRNQLRKSFQSWLEDLANYQTRMLARNTSDVARAIEFIETQIEFVGLVERFDESLVLLRNWSGDEELDIHYRSRNVAKDNRVKQQLLSDPRIVALIREHHEEDYKLYNYVCDVIYQRQAQQYGPSLTADTAEFEAGLPAPRKHSTRQLLASGKRNLIYKPVAGYVMRRAA